ncbi:MAG: hypothetical protein Alpg2KO_32950 [Alphaproteobacteria bacterium]
MTDRKRGKTFMRARKGASLLSYGLIVGLISVVALAAVTSVGDIVDSLMTNVGDTLTNVTAGTASTGSAPTPEPSVFATCSSFGNTGSTNIDPDGPGSVGELTTNCENDTDGGGWTQVDASMPQDFIDAVTGASAQMMVKCANLGLGSSTYIISPDSGHGFDFVDDQVVAGTWNYSGVMASCGSNSEVNLATSWGFSCSNGPGNSTKFYPAYYNFSSDASNNDGGLATVDANGPPHGDANIDICGTGTFFLDYLIFVR